MEEPDLKHIHHRILIQLGQTQIHFLAHNDDSTRTKVKKPFFHTMKLIEEPNFKHIHNKLIRITKSPNLIHHSNKIKLKNTQIKSIKLGQNKNETETMTIE
jgi:hypothetical protein